jgi:hypothetical protein
MEDIRGLWEYLMRVSRRRISVRIRGSVEDGGCPRLSDFLQQLEAVKLALRHTERLASGSDDRSVYYRVVELTLASPATVVLEETPFRVDGRRPPLPKVSTSQHFLSALRRIERGRKPARTADLAALEAYRSIGAVTSRNVDEVTIASGRTSVAIGPAFVEKIDKIIGPDQTIEGSLTGVLLAINLHNTSRFEIYPPVGPPRVACDFPRELREQVIRSIDHNVRVTGKLKYKSWAPYPHAIYADDIEIFPRDGELPTLADLRGIALESGNTERSGGHGP